MSDFIPASLVPAGVNDKRSRDFVAALSALLEGFSTSALLAQDPLTVPAALLPVMTVELGMSDFIAAGLLEEHVRALLAAAPDIHAMTGTVAGTRRALGAIGVTVDWTQWWQRSPAGPHDTHEVVAYVNDHLFPDQAALLTAETQTAVLRLIRATQRWSQEIDFKLGIGSASAASFAAALESVSALRPTLNAVAAMPEGSIGLYDMLQRAEVHRPSAMTASPHPEAVFALVAGTSSVQIIRATMEASA